ncbi:MAG: LysR family transcriptional regulator [Polyangiaceae bacterium]
MIESLRAFLLIAEHGTLTGAARHAHVTQPALTATLRRLEESFDARLFDRGRSGATLTEAGRALLPHARAAVVAADEGRRAVEALAKLEAGEVRIGGGASACTYLLPPVLSAFRKRFPKVALRLREAPEELALAAFEAGELDIVVISGKRGELFRHEQLVLVAAPHVVASELPFVAFLPGSLVRATLDKKFPGAEITMELGSISTVKGAVRAGLGKALIGSSAVATDLALGRLVLVNDKRVPIARELRLVHRGLERLPPAARALRAMLLASRPAKARRAAGAS